MREVKALSPENDSNFQVQVQEAINRLDEALSEIFHNTIEQARKRKTNWDSRLGREYERDLCKCPTHSIPAGIFSAISGDSLGLMLSHYASIWLDDSASQAQVAYRQVVSLRRKYPNKVKAISTEFMPEQWAYELVIQQIRDSFRLNPAVRERKFYPWAARELRSIFYGWLAEVLGVDEERVYRKHTGTGAGMPRVVRRYHECGEASKRLEDAFCEQLDAKLAEISPKKRAAKVHQPGHLGQKAEGAGKRRGRLKDKTVEDRRKKICAVAKRGLEGLQYCKALGLDLETPETWQREGCPKSYIEAYKQKRFRQRIYDEKHRNTRSTSK